MATAPKIAVALNPVPGFCVKSKATNVAGSKIFVNIAWDANVPPPPPGSEDAIRNAMQGLGIDESNPDAWFVPVVVSDARPDSDKGGQPAIVFDCVFNASIKSRTLKDPEFKAFIIELAFQRIEAQSTIVLSRQIGTPNIASKGKPQARQVLVPAALYPPGHPNHRAPIKLIQEITDRPTPEPAKVPPKGILKKSPTWNSAPQVPTWTWTQENSKIRIVIDVPAVTHAVIPESTLDVEARRVILHIPSLYNLDINLDASDAELSATFANEVAKLKGMRNLDVDGAKAEWRVADNAIVLLA
ncbi:hypothetical protein PAXINDRAFT_110714 [Paxillus involutus ATCC 200175]|nr:hypothetical protein PAXINDRAFT_110714 [Paxillus involutus ATCC 200175]